MILLTKAGAREAKKCRVTELALRDAIARARDGKVDAQLGATMIKQEVARPPEGRKTACRAIIAFRKNEQHSFIMHIYAKSAKVDLSPREKEALVDLSKQLFELPAEAIDKLIRDRGWKDIESVKNEDL